MLFLDCAWPLLGVDPDPFRVASYGLVLRRHRLPERAAEDLRSGVAGKIVDAIDRHIARLLRRGQA